jgi:signal transduction histidine kinase
LISALIGKILTERKGEIYSGIPVLVLFILFTIYIAGYFISRLGRSRQVAYILLGLYLLAAAYTGYKWGADVPQSLLIYALIIVMSGILVGSRFAFVITAIVSFILLTLSYLQDAGTISISSAWKTKVVHPRDAFISSVTLLIISLVSWLSNREIERSLRRAWRSEAAVEKQRDKLEITVEKRTKQLKVAQAEKLGQLYRFAQFGRMASGLFHDLANPLNLVSLNLDLLGRKSRIRSRQKLADIKVLLKRAVHGTRRLESFIHAARRQVQHQEVRQMFSLKTEIDQTIDMLKHTAAKSHVKLLFKSEHDIKTFGNPVKFSQLITNLVSNAIDAYETTKRKIKIVEVRLQKINSAARFEVQDWGSGINKKDLPKIFDPLFTTKSTEKGMGMGLSISKDIIEKDLKGKCIVKSKIGVGTTFIVEFPIRKNLRRVG